MNTLADRIRIARKSNNMTQVALAKAIGVSKSSVNQWESGLTKNLIGENLLKTARALSVKPDWLISGKGEKDTHGKFINHLTPSLDLKGHVPLLSWVNAGNWSVAIEHILNKRITVTTKTGRRTFALRVNGDSMEPEFIHGDIIIVEPDIEAQHGHFVIAKKNEDVTFKQLWKDGEEWYLKPLNTRYPIKLLGDSQVIGVVREKIKVYC